MDSRLQALFFSSHGLPSRPMSSSGQIDALDDERQLRRLYRTSRQAAILIEGGTVATLLQTFCPHRDSVAIPVHETRSHRREKKMKR
jgi:hypothetical protein